MANLSEKIKELETKYKHQLKAEKAKLMAKYRADEKKKKDAENRLFLQKINQYRKSINNDNLLFGSLENCVKAISKNDTQKLDYFTRLVEEKII